jgi:hypothetical protein
MSYNCKSCHKKYSQKTAYQNHYVLCELLEKTKSEEEGCDLPSYKDLVKLVGILAVKNSKLEEKVVTMQKWVDKSKRKINIIEWLNANVTPTLSFAQFFDTIILSEKHINLLDESNMLKTLTSVFEEYFKKENNLPIYAFKEKQNTFYSYDDATKTWTEMQKDQVVSFLYYIDRKVQTELTKWQQKYYEKIKYNDKWQQTFTKLVAKVNALSYRDDATLSKMKGIIFNLLKCEVKRYVEYEFEF